MSPSNTRRWSLMPPFMNNSSAASCPPSPADDEDKHFSDDVSSHHSVPAVIVHAPMPSFQVKRVDCYYSSWSKSWKYRNMSNKIFAEPSPPTRSTSIVSNTPADDKWKDYAMVLVRIIPIDKHMKPGYRYVIKSTHVRSVCEDVIRSWPGIKWDSDPLEISPQVLITFYKRFCIYRDTLEFKAASKRTMNESYLLASVSLLIDAVNRDFGDTLRELEQLLSRKEITATLLHTLFIPGSLVVAQCADTRLPKIFRLVSVGRDGSVLECESFDLLDSYLPSDPTNEPFTFRAEHKIGKVKTKIVLRDFDGTVKITDLAAYPIMFYPNETNLREQLAQRGRKWLDLIGIRQKQYDGPAFARTAAGIQIHNIKSRIMIDRTAYRRFYAEGSGLQTSKDGHNQPGSIIANDILIKDNFSSAGAMVKPNLNDEDLLLTPTIVYGFSLSDKLWLEFNIGLVAEVEWNDGAFQSLVLPAEKKSLLRSIVDAHHKGLGVDDFVKEKGQGLVVNLSGPPGVGKTFSAEATSEHVKKPLYVVGCGELGTTPEALESALRRIFEVATTWKAIVLIDEADVFLEERSHSDMNKNAMVAVFLRHIEYYRGILFLTTNRLSAYDEAFLSRVHVALHFPDLCEQSRLQVWAAFIAKLDPCFIEITASQLEQLAKRELNGRQIKNAVRTAQTLSMAKDHKIRFVHFLEALDALEDFRKLRKRQTLLLGPEDATLMYSS
ncbi:hypothetical protein APHAL10511_006633 [Amanita phalloides]|nr:hypothetical protein APHAL10511_006633 [Amanita phalloides]